MNSSLNPEAPEFHPNLTSITQVCGPARNKDGYTKVSKVVRSSHNWPSGASFDIFKIFTDFNIVSYSLRENVIEQTNQIVVTELPSTKLKCNDKEYNIDKITDANDNMLDRVNINIDTIYGVNISSQKFLQDVQSPIISKIKVGSTTFIGAKNIPRPQLLFKEPVDNSEKIWVPKIADKPNNIAPLALKLLYDVHGNVMSYEHPYHMELELFQPSIELIAPDPEPPQFPPPIEHTKLTYVDTEEHLEELFQHLLTVDELAVDLEHHSFRSYQGITCLMQITTELGGDFIIDTLAMREHMHKFNIIFTDPKKLKVFHGAENDVLWLQRDFGIYLVGLFDTYQAAKMLNLSGLSLKHLLMRYCRIEADKSYQMADWRIRPLPDVLVAYARTDTHYLLYVWRIMKSELLKIADGSPHLLEAVFQASRLVCEATYNKKVVHEESHVQLFRRSKKDFTVRQMTALKMLYKWRDVNARELDESDQYLMPNHILLKISEVLPREVQGILACCTFVPPFIKQNLLNIHKIILSCLEIPNDPSLYVMPESNRADLHTEYQPAFYNFHDMVHYSDFGEDNILEVDYNQRVSEEEDNYSDIPVFRPKVDGNTIATVSNLNADAQMFIPPYDRYRKYRCLGQKEEMKDFKEREAKVAAIGKDSEIIRKEVITKLQQAQAQITQDDNQTASTSKADNDLENGENKEAEGAAAKKNFNKEVSR